MIKTEVEDFRLVVSISLAVLPSKGRGHSAESLKWLERANPCTRELEEETFSQISNALQGPLGAPVLETLESLKSKPVGLLNQLIIATSQLSLPERAYRKHFPEKNSSEELSYQGSERLIFGAATVISGFLRDSDDVEMTRIALSTWLKEGSETVQFCILTALSLYEDRAHALIPDVVDQLNSLSLNVKFAAWRFLALMEYGLRPHSDEIRAGIRALPELDDEEFKIAGPLVERCLRSLRVEQQARLLPSLWNSSRAVERELGVLIGGNIALHPLGGSIVTEVHNAACVSVYDGGLQQHRLKSAYTSVPLAKFLPHTESASERLNGTLGDLIPTVCDLICSKSKDERSKGIFYINTLKGDPQDSIKLVMAHLQFVADKQVDSEEHLSHLSSDPLSVDRRAEEFGLSNRLSNFGREFLAIAEVLEVFARVYPRETKRHLAPHLMSHGSIVSAAVLRALSHVPEINLTADLQFCLDPHAYSILNRAALRTVRIRQIESLEIFEAVLKLVPKYFIPLDSESTVESGHSHSAHEDWKELCDTVVSMGRQNPAKCVGEFAKRARTYKNDEHLFMASVSLMNLLCQEYPDGYFGIPIEAIHTLADVLADETVSVQKRLIAAQALGHCGHHASLACEALSPFVDDDWEISAACLESLGKIGCDSYDYSSFGALGDPLPYLRSRTWTKTAEAAKGGEDSTLIRSEAFGQAVVSIHSQHLGNLGVRLADYLQMNSGHYLEIDRTLSIASVTSMLGYVAENDELHPELFERLAYDASELLRHSSVTVRANSARLLGALGQAAVHRIPTLCELAHADSNEEVREACHVAIGRIGEPREMVLDTLLYSWQKLLGALRSPTFREERLRHTPSYRGVAYGIAALLHQEPQLTQVLEQAFFEPGNQLAGEVLHGISRIRWTQSVQRLMEFALLNTRDEIRTEALNSLAIISHGKYLVGTLQALTRSDFSPTVVKLAEKKLQEITDWQRLRMG